MQASALISDIVFSIKTSDTVRKALERMTEFKVSHLPVVNKSHFLGLIAEEELLEVRDGETAIEALSFSIVNPFVFNDAHIYDVIKLQNQLQLSLIPVLDKQSNYLGAITLSKLLAYAADLFSLKEPGGIIILSIGNRNNSLAHIAHIVEMNNAQILSSYVNSFPDSTKLKITLKINRMELSGIIAAFERYNYEVTAFFNNVHDKSGTTDRYNSLITYLNV